MTTTGIHPSMSRTDFRLQLAICLLCALFLMDGAEAAIISPVGGSMTATAFATARSERESQTSAHDFVPGNYGVFTVHAKAKSFTALNPSCAPECAYGGITDVSITVEIQNDRLGVDGTVAAYSQNWGSGELARGSGQGSLNFALDAPMTLDFAWSGFGQIHRSYAYLSQGGSVFFACAEGLGCASAPFVNGFPFYPLPGSAHFADTGSLRLVPGRYDLIFLFASEHGAGATEGARGSLSLAAVPLPSALALFGSVGLPLAFGRRRRPGGAGHGTVGPSGTVVV